MLAAWHVRWSGCVDLYWLIGPDLLGHGHEAVPLTLHWLDVAAPLGLGGLWLFFFARELRRRPLLPVGEPEVDGAPRSRRAEAHAA